MARNPKPIYSGSSASGLSLVSLFFLLVLTAMAALFIHQVSPLRDPSFQPNSANGGTLIPWLQWVRESDWIWGATVLSMLLASNMVIVLWQWSQARTSHYRDFTRDGDLRDGDFTRNFTQRGMSDWLVNLVIGGAWVALGTVMFCGLQIGFIGYLLVQWLVD